MKRILGILLVTLIVVSAFGPALMISPVKAQSENQWPNVDINGDGKTNLEDTIEYAKNHYVSYNAATGEYLWDYSDPYDTAMANYFMQSVLYVESIRDSNNDKSILEAVNKLIDIFAGGLALNNFDGTQCTLNDDKSCATFTVKNFLTNLDLLRNALDPLFTAGELVDFLLGSGLSSIEIGQLKTELLAFLIDNGEAWLVKIQTETNWISLRFDSADAPPTSMLGKVAGYFRVAMKIADFLNVLMEHMMNIIQIGKASIMDSVKSHEIGVEFIRGVIEVVGKLVKEFVGKPIEAAYAKGLITACAGLAVMGGPPGIVAAAVVGVAGVALYFAVEDIVDEGIEWLADETLSLDLAIYKKLASSPNEVYIPLYQVEVTGINTFNEDNYIPWGSGCEGEDIYIRVRNTGARTLNLRVEPEIFSIDPETGKTGWTIDDKEPDFDNWREKQDFMPGDFTWWDFRFHVDSGTIDRHRPFDPRDDEWIPGENPAAIAFSFKHDWLTEWWDVFDLIGGLKDLGEESAFFYNVVDTFITVQPGYDVARGKTTSITVDVKNLKTEEVNFIPEVKLITPQDKFVELEANPSEITIGPQESMSFKVDWTAPDDASIGFYSIMVNGKDRSGNRYTDNLAFKTIFYLYETDIIFPTSLNPANAGDPTNPNPIYVYVTGLPPLETDPDFMVRITGGVIAEYEIVDSLPVPAGYTLKVFPPAVLTEGKYELRVFAHWGDGVEFGSEDLEPNAVEYTSAPSIEPIDKGFAWLRTSQYADGSWRSNVGVTALCALTFLNAGFDESDPTVQKAIQYLLSNAHSDGSIYGSYATYETSLALVALVATHNSAYQAKINSARDWLVNSQWDESCTWGSVNKDSWYYGGFGYGWNVRPDLSNSQFALLALDASGLPKDNSVWTKAQVFLHRTQNINFPITLNIEGSEYTVQPYNTQGGYDGGFIYYPGASLAGDQISYGSMTGAGIWGLLLSGVPKADPRVVAAMNWVRDHYAWDTNPGIGWWRMYYYYLSMSKALTMYGQPIIDGHDWYQELYDKIVGMQIDAGSGQGYWSTYNEDYVPDLTTAYAILSLQTRAVAPPVQRLSYLTFILRSNCLIRIIDSEGNLVGYNYMTGLGENQIPTAVYSGPFSETQYIVIINPQAGTYKLELIGVSEGPYTLTIQGNYGEDVTDTFEYTGDIKPAELHGSEITVTAIVGPIDIYSNPPEFEKVIDNIPPTTILTIGNPQYTDGAGKKYITSATSLTLTAEDNVGGTGVASTHYRIYNTTSYDTGLITSTPPIEFHLNGIDDGEYSVDFYSVDNIGNIEPTTTQNVTLDNTPPTTTPTIGDPKYLSGKTYVTPDTPFTLTATDAGSGVQLITYRINSTSYDSGWLTYTAPFQLTSLTDGDYTIAYNCTDNVKNTETTHTISVTLFSWNYIYQDTYGRGTTLKINLAHKFFQFIRPDKNYGIRNATCMKQCGRAIIITHCDKQLRLITVSVDTKIDFCYAMAWDLQTRKCYLLIDKAGIE